MKYHQTRQSTKISTYPGTTLKAAGRSVAFLIVLLGFAGRLYAQDENVEVGDTVYVALQGGADLYGVVLEMTEETITLRDTDGIVTSVPRSRIRSITKAANRKFRRLDPNVSRLLFGPTARPLGSGNGYFALYEIFFSFAGVGIGPQFNLAGGVTLIPGSPEQVIYGAPKLTFVHEKSIDAAIGVLALKIPSVDDTAGLLYGVATVGPATHALSVGLAFGFFDGEFGNQPVFMIGYEAQASETVKFITENYILPGEAVLISAGVRFFGDKFAGDLAFVTSLDAVESRGFPVIPWLGIALNFGE